MDEPRRRRRKPKAPLALWIVESREAQPTPDGKGWTSDELAERLHVRPPTVRGWEAGRSVSPDNIRALERLFGEEAPGHDEPVGDLASALMALVSELQAVREERTALAARVYALELVVERLSRQASEAPSGLRVPREIGG